MNGRNLRRVVISIAIIVLAVTTPRLVHFSPGGTRASAQTTNRLAASEADSITYYLVNSGELNMLAGALGSVDEQDVYTTIRVAPRSVLAVVDAAGESRLRRTIDDANRQLATY